MGEPGRDGASVDRALVHDVKLGVVFRVGLTSARPNRFSNGEIWRVACDGVTFAGYGELIATTARDLGYDCGQRPTPIPCAAVFSRDNRAGALVDGNRISNVCGSGSIFWEARISSS